MTPEGTVQVQVPVVLKARTVLVPSTVELDEQLEACATGGELSSAEQAKKPPSAIDSRRVADPKAIRDRVGRRISPLTDFRLRRGGAHRPRDHRLSQLPQRFGYLTRTVVV